MTDYNDEVKIEFHREIMPYLMQFSKEFTQHALSDIAELNSKVIPLFSTVGYQ
ncbi:hypothetical protein ICE98_00020 [Lactococcus lactis]|nr:hypothetical protein [Lactococcus lactis]